MSHALPFGNIFRAVLPTEAMLNQEVLANLDEFGVANANLDLAQVIELNREIQEIESSSLLG